MDKKKYTIIIPHHNCLDKLQRGLESIPQRKDIQIIVVDDASTYVTREELNAFQRRNPQIELVFNQENKGPGAARNTALNGYVVGEWVLFMDADDTFEEGAFYENDLLSFVLKDLFCFLDPLFFLSFHFVKGGEIPFSNCKLLGFIPNLPVLGISLLLGSHKLSILCIQIFDFWDLLYPQFIKSCFKQIFIC